MLNRPSAPLFKISFFIAIGMLLMGADYLGVKQLEKSRNLMGDALQITVFESNLSTENVSRVMDKAFEWVESLENKTSNHHDESLASRIQRAKKGDTFDLDDDTYTILKESLRVSRLSDGAIDITAGPLRKIWKEAKEKGEPPLNKAMESVLPKIGYQSIVLDDFNRRLTLQRDGIELDWEGAARAYALDQVARHLREHEVYSAVVRFGESIRLVGRSPEGRTWRVGIEHPRKVADYAAILEPEVERAFSTAGDYQSFFIYKGKRYSHIFDPKTGAPLDNHMASVTIITEKALLAHLVSNAFFVLGPEKGFNLVEALKEDGVEAVCIEEKSTEQFILGGSEGTHALMTEINV